METTNWTINNDIQPEMSENINAEQRREKIQRHLQEKATVRKKQTDKHGPAKEFETGDKIWIKLHRRSDASRRVTRKIHLVYQGPYKINRVIRKNAYLIESLDGQKIIGTYNARQIRPHREPQLQICGIKKSEKKQKIAQNKKDQISSHQNKLIIKENKKGRQLDATIKSKQVSKH